MELDRQDLIGIAKLIVIELEKINELYRDMFRKAGIDLDKMERIEMNTAVGEG